MPLPFVAIAFWFGTNTLMAQELRQPQLTETRLQADTQLKATVSINVLLINATVNRQQGVTQVEVETTEPILKRLELELPMTNINQIEAAIAQELQLSLQDVRQLVRYEIVE
ncbi:MULTISPECIES: hypothetical protein [Cyanophyceae]|uniref:hypothetical protein n=1 Tax=Cyanophyceae TaxID=3028117 RepID=UPI0018EFE82C|nr:MULTISPECIES: hypothetical protein [Cyanophyceae]